jgi:hypothetical protein
MRHTDRILLRDIENVDLLIKDFAMPVISPLQSERSE